VKARNDILATAGVVAAIGAALALWRSLTWLFIVLIVVTVLLIAFAWLPSLFRVFQDRQASKPVVRKPSAPYASRWRLSLDGVEAVSVSHSFNKSVSHPGHSRHVYDDNPSRVIVSVFVPCGPIDSSVTTSALVKSFLELLSGDPMREVILALAPLPEGFVWHSYSSNGLLNNQAVLARSAELSEVPAATALLNLNDASIKYQHFQDPNRAELILNIERRSDGDAAATAASLSEWHGWLLKVFQLPDTFVRFLSQQLNIPTFADMETLLGVWLEGHSDLRDLIECDHFQLPPGAIRSRSIPTYLISDRSGKEPSLAAVDVLRAWCDYGLHAHGYELELAQLSVKGSRGSS
jgi:hypothetical protein